MSLKYYPDYEFSVYFLNFYHSFFWPNLVHQSGILQVTVIWHRDICDYGFDVHFVKMLAMQYLWQIWSQNLAKIISKDCYTCCMPIFFFLNDRNSFSEPQVLG